MATHCAMRRRGTSKRRTISMAFPSCLDFIKCFHSAFILCSALRPMMPSSSANASYALVPVFAVSQSAAEEVLELRFSRISRSQNSPHLASV